MLGANRKGVTAVGLASKKPAKDGLNGASNAAGGHFGYDAAPLTDIVNGMASGSTAVASHKTSKRYEGKVGEMLSADVKSFESMAPREGQPTNQGLVDFSKLTPAQQSVAQRNPTLPENQIITRNGKGEWQYDKQKLTRIAKDSAHPQTQHARDVLTAMSIQENQGKRRNGAAYQAATSSMGLVGSGVLIAGSHGAMAPLVVAGHSTNAFKEAVDMKKPFVEGRQNMRNEKADEVRRRVNDAESRNPVPADAPLQAQAGAYASMFDNARHDVADQTTFGGKIPGKLIDDRKSAAHKSDVQDIVHKHTNEIVQNGMGQASASSLSALADVDKRTGLTSSQRGKHALERIDADPALKAAHTLLTDTGVSKREAAMLMSRMSESALAGKTKPQAATPAQGKPLAGGGPTPLSLDERRGKIADMIGEPGLKPRDTAKDAEARIKAGLSKRS
jgi:hypothetical protein